MTVTHPIDEDAPALARAAREAMTALTAATEAGVDYPGLDYPDDVEDVLGALGALAGGLEQTVSQLGPFLEEMLRAGRLDEGSSDPAASVRTALSALGRAEQAAGELRRLLAEASAAVTAATPGDG